MAKKSKSTAIRKRQEAIAQAMDINWLEAADTAFANHLTVQFDGSSFFMTFYQIVPPLLTETNQADVAKKMSEAASIDALPVVRLAVPPKSMLMMIKAMQGQFEKVHQIMQAMKDQEDGEN